MWFRIIFMWPRVLVLNIFLFVFLATNMVYAVETLYVYIAYVFICSLRWLKKKIAFPMCNIIYLLRITLLRCPLHCPSAALTFLFYTFYHFAHRPEHATDITRRTITFVVVRFYCRRGRLWWAVVGNQEKPSKMDLGRRWPPGASNIKLLMGLYYLITIIVLYIYGTARRGFNYCVCSISFYRRVLIGSITINVFENIFLLFYFIVEPVIFFFI